MKTLTLPALLLACCANVHAQDNIRFARGANAAGVSGQVSQTIKTWQFRAQRNQRVTVALEPVGGDKGMLTMTVYAYCGEEYGKPLASDVLRWEGQLPCSDRYTIDVTPSREAMEAKRVQRYTLTLGIR